MGSVPSPDEVEPGTALPLDALTTLLRSWRNHWAAVERIARDFPEDVRTKILLRPVDTDEALAETRAQFAVLFHPEAVTAFVSYLNAAIDTVDRLIKRDDPIADDGDVRRLPGQERVNDAFARLEERVNLLDMRLAELLQHDGA